MSQKDPVIVEQGTGKTAAYKIDYGTPDLPPEGLYDHAGLAPTLQGPQDVDDAAVAFYRDQGYLALNNLFSPEQVESAKAGLAHLIAGGNPDFNGLMLEKAGLNADLTSLEVREAAVRKLMTFCKYDRRLHDIAHDPALIRLVEKLTGEKVEIFQEMALLKPPSGREKPWHQDHAYFDVKLKTHILGVWIALDEALVENGCMHVMPGKHREPVVHFKKRDWQICDNTAMEMRKDCLAVPLPPGGALFFDSFLPHGTPTNHSNLRRRALQFHYRPRSVENCSLEDRLKVFGSEGKDVTC